MIDHGVCVLELVPSTYVHSTARGKAGTAEIGIRAGFSSIQGPRRIYAIEASANYGTNGETRSIIIILLPT